MRFLLMRLKIYIWRPEKSLFKKICVILNWLYYDKRKVVRREDKIFKRYQHSILWTINTLLLIPLIFWFLNDYDIFDRVRMEYYFQRFSEFESFSKYLWHYYAVLEEHFISENDYDDEPTIYNMNPNWISLK